MAIALPLDEPFYGYYRDMTSVTQPEHKINSSMLVLDYESQLKESHDEIVSSRCRGSRKNQTSLGGWLASAILGLILFWSFLPPGAQDAIFFYKKNRDFPMRLVPRSFANHFIFGDSYSSTNFNIVGQQPSEGNVLGNSNKVKPVWINFMADIYDRGIQRIYNLALDGSTVDGSLVQPPSLGSTSLRKQIRDRFLPHYVLGSRKLTATWTSSDTLFTLWFGINDVIISAGKMQLTPLDRIFDSYRASMQMLYDVGARHFLILNIPPIDLVYLAYDTTAMRSDIASFNARLLSLRLHFQRENPDAIIFVFDVHELYLQASRKPESFEQTAGIKNTTEICPEYLTDQSVGDVFKPECGVPLNQYFWQNLHTTASVHNATAAFVVKDCFGSRTGLPHGYCS